MTTPKGFFCYPKELIFKGTTFSLPQNIDMDQFLVGEQVNKIVQAWHEEIKRGAVKKREFLYNEH